jgi:inorganic pyrophosphatase
VGDAEKTVIVRVEIPKGSRNKYEYDEALGAIKLDRFLFSSMVYPTDYGYFPETLGEDDDPLDAMVCVSEATFPGCIIEAKPIALFKMEDEHGIDDKVLCVPVNDPAWNTLSSLDDLSEQLRDEIEHFFSVYKDLEQKKVSVDGWYSREEAFKVIDEARERFQQDSAEEQPEPKN